jgi:hypothetical protein
MTCSEDKMAADWTHATMEERKTQARFVHEAYIAAFEEFSVAMQEGDFREDWGDVLNSIAHDSNRVVMDLIYYLGGTNSTGLWSAMMSLYTWFRIIKFMLHLQQRS